MPSVDMDANVGDDVGPDETGNFVAGAETDDLGAGETDEFVVDVDEIGTQEDVISAYLAPDAEIRRRVGQQELWATNVRRVEPTSLEQPQSHPNKWFLVVVLVIAAAIGISLGITLNGTNNNDLAPAMSPTQAPTTSQFAEVAAIIESLYGRTWFQNPLSPQYQAVDWLANVDANLTDFSDSDRFRQRYSLAVFYFATGGPESWTRDYFFLQPDVHECDWQDTAPNDTYAYYSYIGVHRCSEEQWVEGIELNQNNLTGTLPEELGSMPALVSITLIGNDIGGTLPPSLFNLSNLFEFDVLINHIAGTIPPEIGKATALDWFQTAVNPITGTIATEIGMASNLRVLGLTGNFLTGTMPAELLRLEKLEELNLEHNALSGSLPPLFSSSWPNLLELILDENLLTGTIPNDLDSLSPLQALMLEGNNFTGPFPASILALTNVTCIWVSLNALTGTLPSDCDWNNLSQSLRELSVEENRFTGSLPESLGNLAEIETLSVSENELNGTIPAILGNATSLKYLRPEESLFRDSSQKLCAAHLFELIVVGAQQSYRRHIIPLQRRRKVLSISYSALC